ncbi:MAG: Gfo/Idh/MocA family oxidoreductase [Gemmatimonadota bacterium]|nr:Gfo/Idh/MocA family oxidoreductase [Gemmatimonadota bacterium]
MPAETYGILLVSFSKHSHQQHFIPLYQAHPRLRIIGVADHPDIDPDLRAYNQQWAGQLGVPYSEDLDESIDDPAIDIVSVGCEIERRSALIVHAAEAGKHLWIDKFPGATLAESEASAAAVERTGVRAIIPGYAYGTLAQHTRQVLASGDLGTLLGVHVDVMFGKGWPRPITQRRDFVAPNGRWKYPDIKRELLTVGAYAVGLIQECLGPIRHVVGHAGAFFFPEHGAHGCDDFGTLTMTDADGRVATLCGGRIGTASHPQGGPSRAYLIGTRQSATIDAKRPALDAYLRDYSTGYDYRPDPQDPMQWHGGPPVPTAALSEDTAGQAAGLDDLVAAIDDDRPPRYGVRQARDLMEIILAGYRAVECNAAVDLPLEQEL